jgi:hypothetical protein
MSPPLRFDPIEEAARQWRERWGEEPIAAMRAVTSLMRVQQLWLGRLNEALRPHGLTFARYEVLMLLHFSRGGALPLGKVGERLQVHPTSVTSLIDGRDVSRIHPTAARRSPRSRRRAGRRRARRPRRCTRSASAPSHSTTRGLTA